MFNWSSLALRLSNQDPRPLSEVKPTLSQGAGLLFKAMEFIRFSIYSVIVSSPLKASSISARELVIALMRIFIYSHSCMNEF